MSRSPTTVKRSSGMHRFADGRIAETWTAWDNLAVLSQLGLMPGD